MSRVLSWLLLIGLSWGQVVCSQTARHWAQQHEQHRSFERIDDPNLPNAYRLHSRVISGGQPAGEAGFRALNELGVKTIISVDGAKPEVELAAHYRLRYVHLPHGYDGVPAGRARQLAKAVRELPGPIYIHCHHGKHRSPAAAAVACVGAGLLPAEHAAEILERAGTGKNYRGLYGAAKDARRFDDASLDVLDVAFVETAPVPPMAEAMVAIERLHDHLGLIEQAGWYRLEKHPDLEPAHEALMLREHFTELLRSEAAQSKPAQFQQLLNASEAAAAELESVLRQVRDHSRPARAKDAFGRVSQLCSSCHRQFRDIPRVP